MAEIATSMPEVDDSQVTIVAGGYTAGEDTASVLEKITMDETEVTVSAGGDSTPTRFPILLGLFKLRREEWAYSFPVVLVETMWNLAFVALSFAALFWFTREDTTNWRLRVWIFTYSIQCIFHVVVLLMEYKKRSRTRISSMLSSISCCSTSKKDGDGRVTPIRNSMIMHMLLALFAHRCEASIIVRQNVALQLKNWRDDWSYKFPFVVLDVLWNLTFEVLSFAVLCWFEREDANWRLKVYIFGHSLQRVLHVVFLLLKYKKRTRKISSMMSSSCSSSENDEDYVTPIRCQMVTKAFPFLWWLFGFFCLMSSYTTLGNATFLLWLTVGFLAMDVFFAVLHLIFVSLVEGSESEAEINNLIDKFEVSNADVERPDVRTCRIIPMTTSGSDFSAELVLQTEDAECCICFCDFEDGGQLLILPCNHTFHPTCIVKWLRLKASCPVCKSLVTPSEQV